MKEVLEVHMIYYFSCFLGQQMLKFELLRLKNLDLDFPIIMAIFDNKKNYKWMIHKKKL
jgi:hypothetical protein